MLQVAPREVARADHVLVTVYWHARTHDELRKTLRPLLDLPVERVLVSHGALILSGGKRALAAAWNSFICLRERDELLEKGTGRRRIEPVVQRLESRAGCQGGGPEMRATTAASSRSTRLAEGCVVAVVAASSVVGLGYFAKGLSGLDEGAAANSELSFADREFGGGNGVVLDQQAAYVAEGLIPAHATYRLLTGSGLKEPTSLTLPFVDSWFRYFLMPRRPADDAKWLICYGCDTSQFGGKYTPRWQDDRGISIGRLG